MRTARLLAVAATLWLSALAALPAAKPAPGFDLASARILDLTHPFAASTLYWPTAPSGFEHKQLQRGRTAGGYFYAAYAFCAPEHGGTHLDAPSHFSESGRSAEAIAFERLVAKAAVIDVTRKALGDSDYRLSAADVRGWEKDHGDIERGTIVLLRTGWSVRWPDAKLYLGDDAKGDASRLHFPGLGREAAQLLLARKVAAIGVDTASIDHGPSQDFIVHQTVAAANLPVFENLTGLEHLPARGAWVIALPMKIEGGSGAPLRIVALLPR